MSLLAHSKDLIKDSDTSLIILGSLLLGWHSVTDLFLVKSLHYLPQLRSLNQRKKSKGDKKSIYPMYTIVAKTLFVCFANFGATRLDEIILKEIKVIEEVY